VITPDWAVRTGHDEELERIAAALGAGVSCIDALAAVLPAFRTWWLRATRQAGLLVRSDDLGRHWHCADGRCGCCPATGFADPTAAAGHAREARHVAATTGASRIHLVGLVAGLGAAADPAAPAVPDAGPRRAELIRRAWAAGLAPAQVAASCAPFDEAGLDPDLPCLLALAQTGADPHWVLASAAATHAQQSRPPGPAGEPAGLLARLAWTPTELDRRDPGARGRWLATGARWADLTALSAAGYPAAAAAQVGAAWGVSEAGAAQVLARWVDSGLRPHPAQLAALRDAGLSYPPGPPGPAAVDRLAGLLGASPTDAAQRTELALAIARHGTIQAAAVALARARATGGRAGQRSA